MKRLLAVVVTAALGSVALAAADQKLTLDVAGAV
jgi:hypothetical protein